MEVLPRGIYVSVTMRICCYIHNVTELSIPLGGKRIFRVM